MVPEVLLPGNSEKAKKQWKSLAKKKKGGWSPKDHELFGKFDLWMRCVLVPVSSPCPAPRKWISEVFVGVLSGDSLLYVWDVIFMHNWSKVATCSRTLALSYCCTSTVHCTDIPLLYTYTYSAGIHTHIQCTVHAYSARTH